MLLANRFCLLKKSKKSIANLFVMYLFSLTFMGSTRIAVIVDLQIMTFHVLCFLLQSSVSSSGRFFF